MYLVCIVDDKPDNYVYMNMKTILYLSSNQYSGTTLTSFLLNSHPDIVSVGHSMGWNFDDKNKFLCSCGVPLSDCKFWKYIEKSFHDSDLPFKYNDFGTRFSLSKSIVLDRVLTGSIPGVKSSCVERLRDWIVGIVPIFKKILNTQRLANKVLFNSSMDYSNAKVFLDNSHDPYRLRFLKNISDFNLKNIHLVRDPRGVGLSNMRNKSWSLETSTRLWLRHHSNIDRISREVEDSLLIFYEDVCANVGVELSKIYNFLNLGSSSYDGDFKNVEHHILGNDMRFGEGSISIEEKWRQELSEEQKNLVMSIVGTYEERESSKEFSKILRYYLQR